MTSFVCKQQALSAIWFHAKFHTLPKSRIRQIEAAIKKFICKGKSRFIINYRLAKLPRHLGGLGAPDVFVQYHTLRLSWIKALLDENNNAEWRTLAIPRLDTISKRHKMGLNILRYPHLVPKRECTDFWTTNLQSFRIFGGKVEPPNPSPHLIQLRSEHLSTYTDSAVFLNKGVTTFNDLIASTNPNGSISYKTNQILKQEFELHRMINKNKYDRELNAFPRTFAAPNYFLLPSNPNELFKVDPLRSNSKSLLVNSFIKPPDTEWYSPLDNNLRRMERSIEIDLGLVLVHRDPTSGDLYQRFQITSTEKLTKQQIHSDNTFITLGEDDHTMKNSTINSIYKALLNTLAPGHQHAPCHDTKLEVPPDWAELPNRRPHPVLPRRIMDLRFKTIHNRHYIGRQLIHMPNIRENIELCPHCEHITADLYHIFLECPIIGEAWAEVVSIFESLMIRYINIDGIDFQLHHFILGIPTLPKSMDKNLAIILTTLDIFIGHMQLTIQDQYRKYTMDNIIYTTESLLGEWHQKMITSVILINLRMKRRPYRHQWMYSKPDNTPLPLNPNRTNWKLSFEILFNSSIKLDDPDPPDIGTLTLTSDLEPSDISDND